MDKMVDVVSSKQLVKSLCIGLMMTNPIETTDTDRSHSLLAESDEKSPSLLRMGRDALSKDARRGLSVAIGLLNVFGAALRPKDAQSPLESDSSKFAEGNRK